MIGGADPIAIAMRQRALDCVGVPLAAFVEQGRCHRAEAVSGHFIGGVAQTAQACVYRVVAHRALARADRGEDVAVGAGQRPEIFEDSNGLA